MFLSRTWSAHYGPKHGHCYDKIVSISKSWKVPTQSYALIVLRDALENVVLAATMDQQEGADKLPTWYCHVRGKEAPCAESKAFITEHMTN
jgi:hypothetical protein